jgi:transcriptional regulator with XRE-family HTH domain
LARRSKGWPQKTLAERIGVDPQRIKRLEKGTGSVETLIDAMEALELRLSGIAPGATITDQLRAKRQKRGWSISHAAQRAGLDRATVADLERGNGSVASLQSLLTVVAPNAKRRAPERSYWGQGDKEDRDSRFTPPEFMQIIYAAFGPVDLDPCAHRLSPVVAKRRILLDEGGDGLADEWSGRLAFVNPPYSAQLIWLRRAYEQWSAGNVETVVCLVPVRTDSAWFHQTLAADAEIFFLQGRLRFSTPSGKAQHTPFSLMLVALGTSAEQRERLSGAVPGAWTRTENKMQN